MCAKSKILTYFESLEDLKTPPPVLTYILDSAFKDLSPSEKRRITAPRDPGLTTRMLRVADLSSTASLDGIGGNGAEDGSSNVQSSRLFIASIAIYNELTALGYVDDRIFPEIWRHSLETANIAQDLAGRTDPLLAERAYLCGLLHDIGMAVVVRHFPEEAANIRDLVINGAEIIEAERSIFDTDHQAAGSLVAERWNMPGAMKDTINGHHLTDESVAVGTTPLTLITIVADSLSPVYRESPVARQENDPAARIRAECCRRLEIGDECVRRIYSILPKHLFVPGEGHDRPTPDDFRNYVRMNNELFRLYKGLASMFRERRQISRQLLREKYIDGTWESLNIALSTISHYINNSISVVSGEGEILKQVYEEGNTDEALARIPDVIRAISKTSKRISVLLDELSSITGPDEIRYFKDSKAIDIQKTIEDRLNTEIPAGA